MLKWAALGLLIAAATIPIPVPKPSQSQQQTVGVQTEQQPDNSPSDQGSARQRAPILNGDRSANNSNNEENQGTEYWPPIYGVRLKITDTLLVLFTGLLVWFGARQAYRMRQTVGAFIQGERANIHIGNPLADGLFPSVMLRSLKDNGPKPSVAVPLINYGRTTAFVTDLRMQLNLGDSLPARPKFTHATRYHRTVGILKQDGETQPFKCEFDRHPTEAEIDAYRTGTQWFTLFGYVKYADVFDQEIERGFALVFGEKEPPPGYREIGGSTYNYVRFRQIKR